MAASNDGRRLVNERDLCAIDARKNLAMALRIPGSTPGADDGYRDVDVNVLTGLTEDGRDAVVWNVLNGKNFGPGAKADVSVTTFADLQRDGAALVLSWDGDDGERVEHAIPVATSSKPLGRKARALLATYTSVQRGEDGDLPVTVEVGPRVTEAKDEHGRTCGGSFYLGLGIVGSGASRLTF